jgi:hypothetical protein
VTGYAQSHLVMERFGYPDFLLSSADELIDGQYADRPHLRPLLDAIIAAAAGLDEVIIQARKGYVSLVTQRRTFARVQPTTKNRVDLALRLEAQKPSGRLRPSKLHENMPLQVSLTAYKSPNKNVWADVENAGCQTIMGCRTTQAKGESTMKFMMLMIPAGYHGNKKPNDPNWSSARCSGSPI